MYAEIASICRWLRIFHWTSEKSPTEGVPDNAHLFEACREIIDAESLGFMQVYSSTIIRSNEKNSKRGPLILSIDLHDLKLKSCGFESAVCIFGFRFIRTSFRSRDRPGTVATVWLLLLPRGTGRFTVLCEPQRKGVHFLFVTTFVSVATEKSEAQRGKWKRESVREKAYEGR